MLFSEDNIFLANSLSCPAPFCADSCIELNELAWEFLNNSILLLLRKLYSYILFNPILLSVILAIDSTILLPQPPKPR